MSDEKPKSLKKKIVYSVLALLVVGGLVGNLMESREAEKMAAEGGFESVQEFEAAKAQNIFTKAEYDAYVAQRDEADKAAAEQGGFLNVDEYRKAQYVNMPTKALYDKYLEQQAELKIAEEKRKADEAEKERLAAIAEEKRKADEAEKERLAAIAEEKRKADEAEKVRLAALTPSLTMKCENQKGWQVYIMHLNNFATIIKPVQNPVDGYSAIAENVEITNYGKPEYWYNPEDMNKGFNIKNSSYFRGFSQAKLDLRETLLGKRVEPSFGISAETYNSFEKKWEKRSSGGQYTCSEITLTAFNSVLLKYRN